VIVGRVVVKSLKYIECVASKKAGGRGGIAEQRLQQVNVGKARRKLS
jgi:hypothetical protein